MRAIVAGTIVMTIAAAGIVSARQFPGPPGSAQT